MTATGNEHLSAADMEHEIEATRADLVETLHALEEKLSPDYLVDHAISRVRDSDVTRNVAAFGRNIGRDVRDNPMPLLLMGIGMGWMMLSSRTGRPAEADIDGDLEAEAYGAAYEEGSRFPADPYGEPAAGGESAARTAATRTSSAAHGAAETARQAGARAADAARGTADAARHAGTRMADTARSTADTGRHAGERLAHTAHDAGRQAGRAASAARHGAQRTTDRIVAGSRAAGSAAARAGARARRTYSQTLHEHPLALGMLGLALGAAASALLPRSRTEDRWLGDRSDAVKEAAGPMARQGWEEAKHAAATAYGAAAHEAQRQGLTPEETRRSADRVKEKVEQVGKTAVKAARDDLRSSDGPEGRSETPPRTTSSGGRPEPSASAVAPPATPPPTQPSPRVR